jgi:hypothetical protein
MPITGLHSFGREVPDLAVAEQYYAQFGLATSVRDNALVVSCSGRDHFSDIDQVTSGWQGRRWEPAEAGSAVWSPPMPRDFHLNTEHLVQT